MVSNVASRRSSWYGTAAVRSDGGQEDGMRGCTPALRVADRLTVPSQAAQDRSVICIRRPEVRDRAVRRPVWRPLGVPPGAHARTLVHSTCHKCPCTDHNHRPYAVPNSVHERALSVTDVSYEGHRLADTELLTPSKTHDESMGHLHRLHSAPTHRRLRRSLMPDAHHSMQALALASTAALWFP